METTIAMPRVPEWDNLEICEQALATPRKRGQFLKGLMAASAGLAAAAPSDPPPESWPARPVAPPPSPRVTSTSSTSP